jgi:hypothetical protein
MHSGYKGKNPEPWKKAKKLKLNDKLEAKADGTLSYADKKRAIWYYVDLPQAGQLDLQLEITPPGDTVSEEFDLGFEVLDKDYRMIMRSDLTEGDDAGDLNKSKSLKDLEPGKYYVHLYLQHRMDSADYELQATLKPMASVGASDFPAQVAFVPTLPMVPLQDDSPVAYKPQHTGGRRPPRQTPPKKDEPKSAPTGEMTARILKMQVVTGGTQITVSRGTTGGAATGMKGKVVGVASGAFTLSACDERTCTATVPATPDQIRSGSVVLTP